MPQCSNSEMFRVARVAPFEIDIAAMSASISSTGRPIDDLILKTVPNIPAADMSKSRIRPLEFSLHFVVEIANGDRRHGMSFAQ